MAKKTIQEVFGASATYNSTTGFLSIKVSEIASAVTPPVTASKLFVAIVRYARTQYTSAYRDANPDESVVVENIERAFVPIEGTLNYQIRDAWSVEGFAADTSSITSNSF